MVPPALLVQGDEGQHIDGRFKEIQVFTSARPVETVLRLTAGSISLESALCRRTVLVGVTGCAGFVHAHEYGVVVVAGFIDQPTVGKE
mgnify:FL=1